MADVTLASLNFKLGIPNEQEFNDKIKAITDTAQKMNTEVSDLLTSFNKMASGGAMSQPKKNQILTGLRNEIKATEVEIARLENKLKIFANNANMNGQGGFASPAVDKKFLEMSREVDELRNKLESLRKTYKDLGGDVALRGSFPHVVSKEDNQELQLLNQQLAEEVKLSKEASKNFEKAAQAQKHLTEETNRGVEASKKQSRLWRDLKNVALAYFSFEGARRLVSTLVQVSAEFEKQRISLRAILQDADGAEKIFGQIKELAVQSPFQFKELVTYTKQLSAFSIPMNELYDTTKMLADVSAGLGVSMDRLVLAYGQIRSASFLRGQEVRQLTEAGIPILTELAKQFEELEGHAVSAGDVFDRISKRQVTFEMVEKVFKDMTSEGGKFYKMQEVLAETLSGKISNLKDAYQIMFAEIGEKTQGVLYKSVDAVRSLAENYEQVGKAIANVVAVYGTYRALASLSTFATAWGKASAAAMIADGTLASGAQSAAAGLAGLIKNTKLYQAANKALMGVNPYALLAASVVALGIGIYKLINRTNAYKDAMVQANNVVTDYNKEIGQETMNLDYLFDRLRGLNAESEEYKNVKDQIINQYGQYLNEVDRENLRIKNLAGIYGTLADAIRNASMQKAIAAGQEKIAEFESGITSKIWGQLSEAFEKEGLNMANGVGKELYNYIMGKVSGKDLSDAAIAAGKRIKTWAVVKNNISRSNMDILTGQNKYYDVYEMREEIKRMREQSKAMSKVWEEEINFMDEATNHANDNIDNSLKGWRKDLADIAKAADDAGAKLEIAVDASTDLIDVRKQLDNEMKESQERYDAYMAAGEEGEAAIWEKRIQFLSQMKKRVGSGEGGGGSITPGASDDETKNIVHNIQAQINVYRKLKDVYEELIETLGESDARALMAAFFPQYGEMVNANFDSNIEALGQDLLALAMYSDDAADAWVDFQDTMSEEQLNKYNEKVKAAAEATENYKALMQEWEDFIPSSGAIGDVLRNYTKTIEKIQKLREDSLRELVNSFNVTDWEDPAAAFVEQSNIINEKAVASEEASLDEAKEKAKKAIEDIYKEWRDVNVDFNNLSDKTINQLNKVMDTIKKFSFANLKPEEQNALLALIPDLETINKLIEEFKGNDIEKTEEERTEKNVKAWKQLAKNIVSSSKALKEFASASNNAMLEGLAQTVGDMGEMVMSMVDGFRSGAELGALVAGVTSIANIILRAATDAAKLKAELASIVREQYFAEIDKSIAQSSTLFGDSWLGKIRNLRTNIKGLSRDINDLVARGKTVYQSYQPDRTFLKALEFYASELNMSLYDENGLFNTDTLEALSKRYSASLTSDNVKIISDLVEYTKKMKELYKDLEDSVKSMFDSLGSDIADSLIESLKATGSAVTDLEETFQGLGDAIFKSMVQSYIIDEVLNKYKDEVMSWWTDETLSEAEIANRMRDFADSVKNDIDLADDRLSAMYEAFMQNNLLSLGEGSEEGKLSGGIKSITEDTANLLASYVNAIRADVAAIRQAVVAENTQALPSPTLAEYLTQIQANTYNNAVAAQNILQRLDSVMTISDGPAFRVFM